MAAIITDDFRRNSTTFLINDIVDKNTENNPNTGFEYFIGIGKSDEWPLDTGGNDETNQNFSTPLPNGSIIESKEILDNLIGAVAIPTADAYHVIPRINHTTGRKYKRWNENDPNMFNIETVGSETYYPCYVVHSQKIYVCLDNNSNDGYANGTYVPAISTSQPSGDSTNANSREAVQSTDGYVWAYVADLNVSSKFNTDQFVSISSTATGTAADATTATGGVVYGFEIVNPGSGIVNGTDVGDFKLVVSDSSMQTPVEHELTVSVTAGVVTGVVLSAGTTPANFIKGIERATVVLDDVAGTTFTTAPVIRALVGPALGFGYTPTKDLPSFYAGLAVNYNGDVEGELSTSLTYRQISLLRNPTRNNDDTAAPPSGDGDYQLDEVYNTLRRFKLTGSPAISAISAGAVIEDTSDSLSVHGAKAFVDYVDDANDYIYFHQNESTLINQQDFTTGDGTASKITIGGTEYTYDATSLVDPEYVPRTGEVIFVENRKPIQRSASQEEEIKLVIQF
jgi:hypothetical protein